MPELNRNELDSIRMYPIPAQSWPAVAVYLHDFECLRVIRHHHNGKICMLKIYQIYYEIA